MLSILTIGPLLNGLIRGCRYHIPGEDLSEASKWRLIQVVKQPSQLFSVVCLLRKRCNTVGNADSRTCGWPRKEWTALFLSTAESRSQRLRIIRYFTRGVPGEDKVEGGSCTWSGCLSCKSLHIQPLEVFSPFVDGTLHWRACAWEFPW
jgi:hypothetical protein